MVVFGQTQYRSSGAASLVKLRKLSEKISTKVMNMLKEAGISANILARPFSCLMMKIREVHSVYKSLF